MFFVIALQLTPFDAACLQHNLSLPAYYISEGQVSHDILHNQNQICCSSTSSQSVVMLSRTWSTQKIKIFAKTPWNEWSLYSVMQKKVESKLNIINI